MYTASNDEYNLKQLNILAGVGVVVNIILNLILIPKYFALGSAIASLVTQTLTALLQIIIAQKIFNFRINIKRISVLILFAIIIYVLAKFSLQIEIGWIYKFISLLILTLIVALILRLINLKVLYDLIKNGD